MPRALYDDTVGYYVERFYAGVPGTVPGTGYPLPDLLGPRVGPTTVAPRPYVTCDKANAIENEGFKGFNHNEFYGFFNQNRATHTPVRHSFTRVLRGQRIPSLV